MDGSATVMQIPLLVALNSFNRLYRHLYEKHRCLKYWDEGGGSGGGGGQKERRRPHWDRKVALPPLPFTTAASRRPIVVPLLLHFLFGRQVPSSTAGGGNGICFQAPIDFKHTFHLQLAGWKRDLSPGIPEPEASKRL